MESFLKRHFKNQPLKIEKLRGDGGHRIYRRILDGQGQSYIFMNSGPQDQSLKDFISIHQKLSKAHCHVPQIFQIDFEKGFLLMEDLGEQMLETLQQDSGFEQSRSFYFQALDELIKLQHISCQKTDLIFDKDFFAKEFEVAVLRLETWLENKIPNIQKRLAPLQTSAKQEMNQVIVQMENMPSLYCHRDFHSRNLMVLDQKIYLLDFQDGGQGPWVYDFTSLVYDSYVELNPDQRMELSKYYLEHLPTSFKTSLKDKDSFQKSVHILFLQRGLKACGCFASFDTENNKKEHLKYLAPTFKNLISTSQDLKFKTLENYFKELHILFESQKEHF